jgi:CrcB protein
MVYFAVAIGGFLGALVRYQAGFWFQPDDPFPWSTLIINGSGCFVLGWFLTATMDWWPVSPVVRIGFATGFVGAYTTFSTYSLDTVKLLFHGKTALAILYLHFSLAMGLFAAWLGRLLAKRIVVYFME